MYKDTYRKNILLMQSTVGEIQLLYVILQIASAYAKTWM